MNTASVSGVYLLDLLQQGHDVGPQLLQLLVRLLQLGLGAAALLLHGLGPGVRTVLVRVTQRLQAQLVLLEVLLLQRRHTHTHSQYIDIYRFHKLFKDFQGPWEP